MPSAHLITELVCPGAGTLGTGGDEPTQIADSDALLHSFIPATNISAIRISPHRILVTGGVTAEERVLPLTVLRYLDLSTSLSGPHAWAAPVALRADTQSQASQKRRRKRVEGTYPVSRTAHTLTWAPDGHLYLIGGLKVGGREGGHPCKSIFALDYARESWTSIESPQATSKSKVDREHFIGPRFAHITVHCCAAPSARSARARARSGPGSLLVHGGYVCSDDRLPVTTVHAFDLRTQRWAIVPVRDGVAPARAYHAAVLLNDHYLAVHGGNCGEHNDMYEMSDEMHVFDVQNHAWLQPALHPDSHPPPSARRLHCAVNGIGVHTGAGVFYGGELESGEYAESLHSLRLVEEDGCLTALWREHQIAPRAPSQMSSSNAFASGAMVASPELEQYFCVGGRGPGGLRSHPFALAAKEEEKGENEAPSTFDTAGSIPLRIRRRSLSKSTHVAGTAKEGEPSSETNDIKASAVEGVGKVVEKGMATSSSVKPSRLNRSTSMRKSKVLANAESESPGLKDDISILQKSHRKIKSGLKRPRRATAAKAVVPMPTENPAPSVSRVVWTEPLNKENSVAGPSDCMVDIAPSNGRRVPIMPRAAKASSAAQPPLSSGQVPDVTDLCTPSPNDDSAFAPPFPKKIRPVESRNGNGKKAFPETQSNDPMDITNVDCDSDIEEVEPTGTVFGDMAEGAADGFITSDALASRGRAIAHAKNQARARGRGRGRARGTRGRGTGRSRAEIQADLDREEEEMELQKRVSELESDNKKLKHDLDVSDKDNRSLNKQLDGLLTEVCELRNICALAEKEKASESKASSGQKGAAELAAGKAQSVLDRQRDAKVNSLSSKIEDMEEEYREALETIEKLTNDWKDAQRKYEEANALYLTEKGLLQSKVSDYEFLRSKMAVYRNAALETSAAIESTRQDNARLHAELLDKHRKMQDLQNAKSAAGSRLEDGIVELSTTKREIASLQSRLSEAVQKNTRYAQAESQWQARSEALQEQLQEVEKAREQKKTEADLLEDKNVELLAQLKTSQAEYREKIAECERMVNETKRAQEQSAKDRREVADAMTEQSRLRKVCDRLKLEVEKLRRDKAEHEKKVAAAIPKLVKEMHDFSSLFQCGSGVALGGHKGASDVVTGVLTSGDENMKHVDTDVVLSDVVAEKGSGEKSAALSLEERKILLGDGAGANTEKSNGEIVGSNSVKSKNTEMASARLRKSKRGRKNHVLVSSSEGTESSPQEEEDPEP